ncbi:hypothetical protein Hanom_Chr01g00023421 [Helianthus anomalus]
MANKSNLSGCFNILNRNGLAWYVDTYAIPASLHPFLIDVLLFHEVHLSQVNPFGLAKVCHFELSCRGLGLRLGLGCVPGFLQVESVRSRPPPPLPEDFKYNTDLYVTLIKDAGRVQKLPEHILVMGRISTIWAEPEWYPTIKWNGEG